MPDIVMQVDTPANRETVRQALTTRPGITGWWTDQAEVPAGTGGLFKPSFAEAPLPFDLLVKKADDTGVIWQTQSFPPHWVGTEIRIELSDNPDAPGTRVLFTHAGFKEADAGMASAAYTWGQTLARLKGYTETGESQPYFVR
jgi:uncharacterized protein YndB with AHSA1/START domain